MTLIKTRQFGLRKKFSKDPISRRTTTHKLGSNIALIFQFLWSMNEEYGRKMSLYSQTFWRWLHDVHEKQIFW